MALETTTAYAKIKQLEKKIKIIQGGQGASKTYSICQIFFLDALKQRGTTDTIVTETYPVLHDGAMADMRSVLASVDMKFDALFNQQRKDLIIGNSKIQFRNLDNKDFHRGKGARRNKLFLNEANRMNWSSVEQLITRTKDDIYLDFNPDREFWVHTQLMNRPDAELLILTYKDNELLDPGERAEIEMRRDNKEWWQIYGEGQLGTYSDRRILNFEYVDGIPKEAKRMPSGMDFGQSPDTTVLVNCWTIGADLYVDEVFNENNLQAEKIQGSARMAVVDKLAEVGHQKGWLIIGDSADAVAINNMRLHGYNIRAVKKGKGSQLDGLTKLRSYNLYVTKRSQGLKEGSENWFWKEDHNGKIIPEPEGHEPDAIAALRYAVMGFN